MQLQGDKCKAVITSTMMETWKIWEAGLFEDGSVNDVNPSLSNNITCSHSNGRAETDRCTPPLVVSQLLYALPLPRPVLSDISALQDLLDASPSARGSTIRVMIDHPSQIDAIEAFEQVRDSSTTVRKWSCFVKVNSGGNRAGLLLEDPALEQLVRRILESESMDW